MNFKVFVSYSSKDEMCIELFLETLRSITGLCCYFFKETQKIAQDTRDDILANIQDSDAFLIFHSKNSMRSSYVQNEIGAAMGLNKQVILCKLDKTEPKGMLKGVNYLDFYNQEMCRRELNKLVSWIQEKIAQRQARAPVKAVSTTEESFDWINFLLLVGIIAGSLYLISRAAKER